MPPSMLSREALVIWMFRIAMNEPIMAAITAIQTVTLARLGSANARSNLAREAGSADIGDERLGLDMALPSVRRVHFPGGGHRRVAGRLRFGLDGRDHRHARP